jgi:hypothetical protein
MRCQLHATATLTHKEMTIGDGMEKADISVRSGHQPPILWSSGREEIRMMRVWTRFNLFGKGLTAGACEHGNQVEVGGVPARRSVCCQLLKVWRTAIYVNAHSRVYHLHRPVGTSAVL